MVKQIRGLLIGRKVDCTIVHYPNGELPEQLNSTKDWGRVRSCTIPVIDYQEEFKTNKISYMRLEMIGTLTKVIIGKR